MDVECFATGRDAVEARRPVGAVEPGRAEVACRVLAPYDEPGPGSERSPLESDANVDLPDAGEPS